MFAEKFLPKQVPLASGADQKPFRWLALLAAFRAWLAQPTALAKLLEHDPSHVLAQATLARRTENDGD